MRPMFAVLILACMVQVTHAQESTVTTSSPSTSSTAAPADDADAGTGASCLTSLDGTVDCL